MNPINRLHTAFSKNIKAYREWHSHPHCESAHWSVFIAYAFVVANGLMLSINAYASSFENIVSKHEAAGIKNIPLNVGKRDYIKPVQDHILVKFKSNIDSAKQLEILTKHKLKEKSELKQLGIKVVSISSENTPEEEVQSILAQEGSNIEFAEVDAFFEPTLTPNDPYYIYQEHLTQIAAAPAWDIESAGSPVTIAILDSGVDSTHPDLAAHVVPGWNFMSNTSDTHDINGHGTAVAGVSGAVINNAVGVAGVSSKASIMPMVVADVNGYGNSVAMANSLVWAADHGARVANISYGGISFSSTIATAAQYFLSKGGVITTSAGNYGDFIAAADNPNYIVVSATTVNDESAAWSTYGNNIDVSAPGEQVVTTADGSQYGSGTGTSFSAPIVAGIAAMIISVNPQLSPAQVTSIIENSATDKGSTGWDNKYGYGRVHAYNAISLALGRPTDNISPIAPSNVVLAAPFNTIVDISWSSATDNIGVTGYSVYRNGVFVGSTRSVNYRDSVIPDTKATYIYEIKARDASDNTSVVSPSVSIDLSLAPQDTTAPTIPTGISARGQQTPTGVQGAVYFTPSTDNSLIEGYDLFRDGVQVNHCIGNSIPCTDTSAQPGATYSYAMRAVDLSGNKSDISVSSTATIPAILDTSKPTTPANLTSSVVNNSSINLGWTASTDNIGVVGYRVYRNNIELAVTNTNSYVDSSAVIGTTYTYFVNAYDAAGNNSYNSNSTTNTIVAVVQPPVTALAITSYQVISKLTTSAQISVKTNKASTARIYYGTSSKSMTSSVLDSTSTTDHVISLAGLKANTTYYYKVSVTAGNEVVTQATMSTFKTLRR